MSSADATLTPDDVAQRYSVGVRTVAGWIEAGELRAVNVSRSPRSKKPRWRVTAEAIEEFELRRAATPAQLTTRARRKRPATPGVIAFYG